MKNNCFVCPITGEELILDSYQYTSKSNRKYPIINGIPRFCLDDNYASSFGIQWNIFDQIQLDNYSKSDLTFQRFYAETNWKPQELEKQKILEVGSGAGRFTEIFLRTTNANLFSIDYSNAVDANLRNNKIYRSRLVLAQASIYEVPFQDNYFDKIFCLGVLQHTPNFKRSISSLIKKVNIGGEIVVDFYPIKSIFTKIHSKYILRPITKRLPKLFLLKLIELCIDLFILMFDILCKFKLGFLTRFIPITDIRGFPINLNKAMRKKWAIMDTFDAFSPTYDNPQKLKDVIKMFNNNGCKVTFGGFVDYPNGKSMVVRAIKITDL